MRPSRPEWGGNGGPGPALGSLVVTTPDPRIVLRGDQMAWPTIRARITLGSLRTISTPMARSGHGSRGGGYPARPPAPPHARIRSRGAQHRLTDPRQLSSQAARGLRDRLARVVSRPSPSVPPAWLGFSRSLWWTDIQHRPTAFAASVLLVARWLSAWLPADDSVTPPAPGWSPRWPGSR